MFDPLEGDTSAERLRNWVRGRPAIFSWFEDPKKKTAPIIITECASKKTLSFALAQITALDHARQPESGSGYLRVELDDGRRFALSAVGIVFAPSFVSTGPLVDCPSAAGFMDFAKLFRHACHLLDDRHEGHEKEALQVMMILLAYLDGARAIGLEVSDEEHALEPLLTRLEQLPKTTP